MASLTACLARQCLGILALSLVVTPAAAGLEISVKATPSGASLSIEVSNQGASPVSLPHDQLPWVSPYRGFCIVVVATAPRAEPLRKVIHWDEPVEYPSVVLKPGDTRAGELELNRWFKGFREAHGTEDLIVFWSWLPQVDSPTSEARHGGWLLLPKAEH